MGGYSVKRDGVVLMNDMSFWQLLTSLITDRDGNKVVVVVLPEDGRTTIALSATRRDFIAALESWAEETLGEQPVLR